MLIKVKNLKSEDRVFKYFHERIKINIIAIEKIYFLSYLFLFHNN